MMLADQREQAEGLRPHEEVKKNVSSAIQVQKSNPALVYKVLEVVGQGAFGEVFKVRRIADGKLFALKYVNGATNAEKQAVINEASLIAFLDSEEIIKCVDLYQFNNRIWIFLEFMESGPLTKIVTDNERMYSEKFCKYALYKTAKGLLTMHNRNVLHRDIKSDNILSGMNGDVKLADLGFSVFLSKQEEYRKTKRGTPNWVSPEIAQGIKYSKEVDVWAFGCFAYELATGYPPFANIRRRHELLKHIIEKPVPPIDTTRWSADFQDFIEKCLKKSPTERYTMRQLLFEHPFLRNIDVEDCKQAWIEDYTAYKDRTQ